MRAAWNTGRLYGKGGQRMAAQYDQYTRTITFVDIDRCIDGTITQAGLIENAGHLYDVVMHRYDHGQYDCYIRDYQHRLELCKYAGEHAPVKG